MRIAFLSVSPEMGGSEVCLLQLVRGVRRFEPSWQVSVVVPREGPLARRARESGAHAHVLPLPPALARLGESQMRGRAAIARHGAALVAAVGSAAAYTRRLSTLLAGIGTDLVHSNGFKMHVLGSRAASSSTPLVWHLHEYVSGRRVSRTLLKRHVRHAAAIVANSESVAADLRQVFGTAAPISTIHNAVDLEEFSPDGPVADLDALAGLPPAPAGTVRVGLPATFGRWKGHEPFLRALQRLGPATPVRGYVIGAPLYDTAGSQHTLEELRALAGDLGIAGRVGFTGFLEQPAPALRALDVVVHASTQPEPFGLVIAEGMACGRAVIASAAGGAAELVRDDVDGLTHPPADVDRLSAAIGRCVDDAALRVRLGRQARATALERFDADRFARAFLDLYRRVRLHQAVRAS
jgi:glycosyltransferase involved in cell wall biosynthesis